MKRCPQCSRIYTDQTVIYCLDDGALLSSSTDQQQQETLVLPQARVTDPFPLITPQTPPAQPQIVRQGVRPGVVYALVALLAIVVAGAAVALYYERGKTSAASDNTRPSETPAKPTPTATGTDNKTQPKDSPTPEKTPGRENAGGSIPGKYPEGSKRLLTESDVAGKSTWELKVMKNEIYARHGYIFKNAELKNYFESQPWYKPLYADVTDLLSNIEIENAAFIKGYE